MGLFVVIVVEMGQPGFSRNLWLVWVPGFVSAISNFRDSAAQSHSSASVGVVIVGRIGYQWGRKGEALRQELSGYYCHLLMLLFCNFWIVVSEPMDPHFTEKSGTIEKIKRGYLFFS